MLTARGGDVALINQTTYFQLLSDQSSGSSETSAVRIDRPSFRITPDDFRATDAAPRALEAKVVIAPGTIEAQGFGGGGSFALTTPDLNFGAVAGAGGTAIPLAFITDAGFANYTFTTL